VCRGCLRGQAVAVKRQRMAKRPREDTVGGHPLAVTACDYARLLHEIHVSAQLPAHPNICRFHGACLDLHDRAVLNLVYEYVDGSDIERMYAAASDHERDWRLVSPVCTDAGPRRLCIATSSRPTCSFLQIWRCSKYATLVCVR